MNRHTWVGKKKATKSCLLASGCSTVVLMGFTCPAMTVATVVLRALARGLLLGSVRGHLAASLDRPNPCPPGVPWCPDQGRAPSRFHGRIIRVTHLPLPCDAPRRPCDNPVVGRSTDTACLVCVASWPLFVIRVTLNPVFFSPAARCF